MLLPSVAPKVFSLDHQSQDLLDRLFKEWQMRQPRNALRKSYVESKQASKHLGISIPPALQSLEVAVGLPETAVEGLASRCIWDGVVAPDGSDDPFELYEVLDENRFDIELPQSIHSALTYSTSFVSTTPGDQASWEPAVKIMQHSALWSAGLWDRVRRQLKGFMAVNDVDDYGRPILLTLMTPFEVLILKKGTGGWFIQDVMAHNLRRVPAEALPFKPSLDRPFGVSRVNRRVMNLTDRAVRAILRLEVHSELFSAPKFLLMGADESNFRDAAGKQIPLWDWYMTRFNAIKKGSDEDQLPSLEQIAQQSPQPHIEQLKSIYAMFAGETKIPLNSLGIVQDNPASAESLYAMKEDLVILAGNANRVFTYALNRIMQNAVILRDGLDTPGDELRRLSQRFRNPAMPSVVSQSDAIVKQVAAIPELAVSDVILEELGYTDEQITRIRSDIRRASSSNVLEALATGQGEKGVSSESGAATGALQDAQILKAQADALEALREAGVDPTEAAEKVGLAGLKFVPGLPITIKPESD